MCRQIMRCMHGGKGPVTGRPQGSPLLCDGLASWCVHGGKGTFFPSPGHFTLCVIRQQSLSAGGFLGQVVTVVGTLASPMGAGGKRQGNRTPGDPRVNTSHLRTSHTRRRCERIKQVNKSEKLLPWIERVRGRHLAFLGFVLEPALR